VKYEYIKKDEYEDIKHWFEAWGWPPIPEQFLPENGIVVMDGDVGICAAWLYQTDTPICWLEHFISNKDATKKQRKEGLEGLLNYMTNLAKELGADLVMTSMKGELMGSKLIGEGYQASDKGMSHYIKVI